jgi:hypothetical protein
VSVTLTAGDGSGGSGVAATYYTTDGTTPTTSSTRYTGAFSLGQSRTVRWFAVDVAGNAEAAGSQQVQVDAAAPTTSITCNTTTCSTGWYRSAVTVRLAASDTGGSGLAGTYYTTDGSTPTSSSTPYTGAFTLSATRTVRWFSADVAGNAEALRSQRVQVDAAAPTTSIGCNGSTCATTTYQGPVTVTLGADDGAGGSGISSTHYTTNGTTPSLSSPTYTGPVTLNASATVRFRSWDVAGNVEATQSRTVQIVADSAPVARLSVSPSSGFFPLTVTADASASTDTDPWPIASYTFTWGDNTSSVTTTSSRVTHVFTKRGSFTVTVRVTDTAGLSRTASQTVTVLRP